MKHGIGMSLLYPVLILMNGACSRPSDAPTVLRPQQARRETLELKLKCADVGRRFDNDWERQLRASGGGSPLASRFAYNEKLNTCIYRGGSMTKELTYHFILDLATNEELARYYDAKGSDRSGRSEQANFNKQETELFGPIPVALSPAP